MLLCPSPSAIVGIYMADGELSLELKVANQHVRKKKAPANAHRDSYASW